MPPEKSGLADSHCPSSLQLQHFTQNEVKWVFSEIHCLYKFYVVVDFIFLCTCASALRSIYRYHFDDEDASVSVICFSIINDLAQNAQEQSCMRRAIDELRESSSNAKPGVSFLFVLDRGRHLYLESRSEEEEDDDMMSRKYHFLHLLNEYQGRCTAEGR